MRSDTPSGALSRAITIAGGPAALGRGLEPPISSQAVSQWKRTPHQHVLAIEILTGVSRHLLRPDLYPRESRRRTSFARTARA